ncbi:MAG: hypothetical protein H6Q05_2019 [Acidobacteria bacterium]|nr:hypothetical protein [Acidobacteriota bacterium]
MDIDGPNGAFPRQQPPSGGLPQATRYVASTVSSIVCSALSPLLPVLCHDPCLTLRMCLTRLSAQVLPILKQRSLAPGFKKYKKYEENIRHVREIYYECLGF